MGYQRHTTGERIKQFGERDRESRIKTTKRAKSYTRLLRDGQSGNRPTGGRTYSLIETRGRG